MRDLHPTPPEHIYRERITDEIFFALGAPRDGLARRAFGWVFAKPAGHFGRIVAKMEAAIAREGLPGGARAVLPDFALTSTATGAEAFPTDGPVLVVSNHVGAYDSLAIAAHIPRRDLTLMVSDVPFLRSLTEASAHYIFVPTDAGGRMAALRAGIEHLKRGGALLVYAHGEVEPDPALLPGAEEAIAEWSPSVEILMRKAPGTRLQLVIASGMLLPRFLNHPLTRLRKKPFHRQKLAETLQILSQMLHPGRHPVRMRVSFARPLSLADLPEGRLMPAVIAEARALLQRHLQDQNSPTQGGKP